MLSKHSGIYGSAQQYTKTGVSLQGQRPPIFMLAVEPETMDCGMELSASVQEALPRLIAEAKRMAEL